MRTGPPVFPHAGPPVLARSGVRALPKSGTRRAVTFRLLLAVASG